MILFIILFLFLSFIATVFKFSMIEKGKHRLIAIVLLSLFSLVIYPFVLEQNNNSFFEFFQDQRIVSLVAFFQIIESILMILLALALIKAHFKKGRKWLILAFSILPSFILLGGIFFIQLYLFLKIQAISYFSLSLLFSLGIGLLLFTSVAFTKWLFRDWEVRAELKILLAFFQILLAMFLPIIVEEIKVPYTNLEVDVPSILVLTVTVLVTLFSGWILNKYRFRLWSK